MEEPVILLLEDFARDKRTVSNVMQILEEMKIVSAHYGDKNALDFFSDHDGPSPSVIIMYMDRPEMISIQFAENAYLIQLEEYGLASLEDELDCEVSPAGANCPISLIQFLASVSVSKGFITSIDN